MPSPLHRRRASNGQCNAHRSSDRVPPRRRRKGYQDHHQLDPVLEAALDNEAARLAAIEDPVQAVHAVNEFFNGLEDALLRVGEPRLLAIIELYEELGSYQRVADATELSKTRVRQLVREARRRGL
jgi:DNA-directed RNA polymerase specialized sigma24 family protein